VARASLPRRRVGAQGLKFMRQHRLVIGKAEQSDSRANEWCQMSKDELIIQLIKVTLGILIAGYFVWWSLEVLNRLPPH
jgi:hypothetical protein